MVSKYGMSESLGPVCYSSEHDEVFIGRDFVQSRSISENVSAMIDSEVSKIIENQYERCLSLIKENMDKLNLIADALIEREKLSGEEFEIIFDGGTLEALPSLENDISLNTEADN